MKFKILIPFIAIIFIPNIFQNGNINDDKKVENIIQQDSVPDTASKTEWNIFIEALAFVESRNNPKALSKQNDGGLLQLRPIYVKEVNRILKEDRYTLDCRFDSIKNIEMFNIIQGRYNPQKDIDLAIYYHNKKAPESYSIKIKNKMKELSNNYNQ
jgi:Soluble lytic murein transglycosylase and related regulatory proteins (some contain LysM/invasin domains)